MMTGESCFRTVLAMLNAGIVKRAKGANQRNLSSETLSSSALARLFLAQMRISDGQRSSSSFHMLLIKEPVWA